MLATPAGDGIDEVVVDAVSDAATAVVDVAQVAIGVAAGAAVGLLLTILLFRAAFRFWTTQFGTQAAQNGKGWRRLTGAAIGALGGLRIVRDVAGDLADLLGQALVLVIILGLSGVAIRLLQAAEQAAIQTYDTADDASAAETLLARRRRTQFLVMRRVGSALVGVVGLSLALLTFPAARSVGTSLLASAGLLGVVAGVAAQGSLKNLFAGIQIAAAEPVRLDDVVVVEGEWGFIEDITVTTVVVRTWDLRRLIYPSAWFIENPFQNWTRRDSQLIGRVELILDHRADVPRIRTEAERLVNASDRWDGEVFVVQVTEATVEGITVRVLLTAPDAQTAFELRCEVREGLVAWIVANDPAALPVRRLLPAQGATGPGDEAADVDAPDA